MRKIVIAAIIVIILATLVLTCRFRYVDAPIHIGSNSVFSNERLTLSGGANCPVVVIGDSTDSPKYLTENVVVENLFINGSKGLQSEEIGAGTLIRNSGIVVRKAKNVLIQNCEIRNCRSAGICIEKGCENVVIRNCYIYDNYFDGIACYESVNCEIRDCQIFHNQAAGLSFDLRFNNSVVENCTVKNNKIGIFIRDCSDIQIFNTKLLDNTQFGCYFNQINDEGSTLPEFIDLVNCVNNSKNNVNEQK